MTYEFSLFKSLSLENPIKVVETIQKYGICVIPSFLEGQELAGFQQDVFKCFEYEKRASEYAPGIAIRMKNDTSFQNKYPIIYSISNSDWHFNIWSNYLGHKNFTLSKDIFLTHEYKILNKKNYSPNMMTHVDKNFRLKMMIYCNDINKNNGAFSCIPKYHKIGKKIREQAWRNTKEYMKLENKIMNHPEIGLTDNDVIPIEMKAGGAIIFHTDCFHRGGIISEKGTERKIIRFHTY